MPEIQGKEWVIRIPVSEFYTVKRSAMILNITTGTIYSRIKQGTLRAVEIGGDIHIPHEVLVEEIEGRTIEELEINEADISEMVDIIPERDTGRKTPLDFLD